MFKHVIPKQQPYFERKKEEFEITKITEAIKAAEQEEAKEAERKKLKEEKKATIESLKLNRPCYDNLKITEFLQLMRGQRFSTQGKFQQK